jgi:anti-sigma B factor antagonist
MTVRARAVTVEELPETLTGKQGRAFFSELQGEIKSGNECIVLDCSRVQQIDGPAIYLLLCCLEEALKHNGDVKLAAMPSEAKAILELAGAARLFERFDTNTEAINSFRRVSATPTFNAMMSGSLNITAESATRAARVGPLASRRMDG